MTRVSSVALSRTNSRSLSSRTISPGVATTLPLFWSAVHTAQRLQDRADLVPVQTRAGGKRELPLDIVSGEQQHAIGRCPVASRAARLLQVVLQRSRNIGMHDQTDIGLVDPHAKGVGGGNHPQVADAKRAPEPRACRSAVSPAWKCSAASPCPFRNSATRSVVPARGTIDHSARRAFGRQVRLDRSQDIGQLGGLVASAARRRSGWCAPPRRRAASDRPRGGFGNGRECPAPPRVWPWRSGTGPGGT